MNSREKILAAVKRNQPPHEALPSLDAIKAIQFHDVHEKFRNVLESIGGVIINADNLQQVANYVQNSFPEGNRYVTTVDGLPELKTVNQNENPHMLEDLEVAVINGVFGVAENAAVWVTGADISIRALPFICQHLVVVLPANQLVHNMHEAYDKIGEDGYAYGVFIAGPSKTADIEQSLVLGAHGPKTMTVFLMA